MLDGASLARTNGEIVLAELPNQIPLPLPTHAIRIATSIPQLRIPHVADPIRRPPTPRNTTIDSRKIDRFRIDRQCTAVGPTRCGLDKICHEPSSVDSPN